MDILDIFLDILLKQPQPLIGIFFLVISNDTSITSDSLYIPADVDKYKMNITYKLLYFLNLPVNVLMLSSFKFSFAYC